MPVALRVLVIAVLMIVVIVSVSVIVFTFVRHFSYPYLCLSLRVLRASAVKNPIIYHRDAEFAESEYVLPIA